MNFKYLYLIFILFSTPCFSQEFNPSGASRISLMPYLENWSGTDDSDFSVFSTILTFSYLPARNTTVSVSSRFASVTGDVNKLSGFPDVQLFLSHQLKEYNVILNTGVNVPSGKSKLNPDEFLTSRLISQNIFNLNTSGFGQGLNIFLGGSWTYPISEKVVLGAGLSYQIKNEYQPISSDPQKYQPSNEISFSAGFDSKFNETSTLSGDFTAIFYGSDKLDGKEIFSTGNRLIFNSLYKQYFGYNTLSFLFLYRAIGKGEYKEPNPLIESEKINPDQLYIGAVFDQRISGITRLKYGAAFNKYEKTSLLFSGYNFYELSLAPEFKVSRQVLIPVILKYALGFASDKSDLKNYEAGIGIRINL